jgi:DNA-binding response OmpR family regulator
VVEDDPVVADTLLVYLQQAGFTAVAVRDGRAGLDRARDPAVRCVILDLMVPGLSGQQVCRQLRAESRVPILMLTARASEDDRIAGLELGADDYVTKPFSPREVVARVQALLRRTEGLPEPPPPLRIGGLEIDLWARRVRCGGREVALTPTELRILESLARQPGRALTRDEILARAFGPDFEGLDRTVDVHVTNLRRKLEPGPEPRYVLTVHGVGYRLAAPDEV